MHVNNRFIIVDVTSVTFYLQQCKTITKQDLSIHNLIKTKNLSLTFLNYIYFE